MNRSQYFRLSFVIFLPLLFLGKFIAEEEVFFDLNYRISCDFNDSSCYGHRISSEELSEFYSNSKDPTLGLSPRITLYNFDAPIIVRDFISDDIYNFNTNSYNLSNPRVTRLSTLIYNNNLNYVNYMEPYAKHKFTGIEYTKDKYGSPTGFFNFQIASDEAKLKNLIEQANQLNDKANYKNAWLYWVAFFIPLITYFILSGLIKFIISGHIFRSNKEI